MIDYDPHNREDILLVATTKKFITEKIILSQGERENRKNKQQISLRLLCELHRYKFHVFSASREKKNKLFSQIFLLSKQ